MIGEFAYEEIVQPEPEPEPEPRSASSSAGVHPDDSPASSPYTLRLDAGGHLAFRARRTAYGSWRVDPRSLTLTEPGEEPRPFTDPLGFLTRARARWGWTERRSVM